MLKPVSSAQPIARSGNLTAYRARRDEAKFRAWYDAGEGAGPVNEVDEPSSEPFLDAAYELRIRCAYASQGWVLVRNSLESCNKIGSAGHPAPYPEPHQHTAADPLVRP